ncbi:MAG: UDP-N-acetylmuramoyl-tripeptide--D-alanyl-D-alanine ligase, partial [Dialister pneumosintes]
KFIALGAKEHGCKQVISCNTLEEAAQVLESIMKKGDTVLLKASHSMHMEKILQLLGGDGK